MGFILIAAGSRVVNLVQTLVVHGHLLRTWRAGGLSFLFE